jgi:hypothetical protein
MFLNIFTFDEKGSLTTIIWPVFGDWGMHLAQVQAFAHKDFLEVLWNNPIYPGSVTAYPVMINVFSGELLSLTHDLVFSMIFPLLFLLPFFLGGLYLLGKEIIQDKWLPLLGITLLFLGGGTIAFDLWKNPEFFEMTGFAQGDYLIKNEYHWRGFFVTLIFPQRALFAGITLGSIILWIFLRWYFRSFAVVQWYNLFLLGLAAGAMSIVHTHTFIFIGLLGAALLLIDYKHCKSYFWLALGMVISSLPFLYLLSKGQNDFSFDYHLRWMGGEETKNFFVFWFQNWGLIFLSFVFVFFAGVKKLFLGKKKNTFSRRELLFFALVLLFIGVNVVQFQKNAWDNGKLFVWIFALGIFFLLWFWKNLQKKNIFVLLFAALLSCSHGIALFMPVLQQEKVGLFNKDDLIVGESFRKYVSPDALVVAPNYSLIMPSTLAGNDILLGYTGWIWSYGLDYSQRERDIKRMYKGGKRAVALIEKHSVDVIMIHPVLLHYSNIPYNREFFYNNYPLLFEHKGVEVYDVSLQKSLKKSDEKN